MDRMREWRLRGRVWRVYVLRQGDRSYEEGLRESEQLQVTGGSRVRCEVMIGWGSEEEVGTTGSGEGCGRWGDRNREWLREFFIIL
jgi:hypothetical protein